MTPKGRLLQRGEAARRSARAQSLSEASKTVVGHKPAKGRMRNSQSSLLFVVLSVLIMCSAFCSHCFRLHFHKDIQYNSRVRHWINLNGLCKTLLVSLAARRPSLFYLSSPNTESLNQDPAVFTARLMYSIISG